MSIDGSGWPKEGEEIHVLMTSNGVPYLNFQTRLLYRTFLRAQRMPGGDKMVAFTRILSRAGEAPGQRQVCATAVWGCRGLGAARESEGRKTRGTQSTTTSRTRCRRFARTRSRLRATSGASSLLRTAPTPSVSSSRQQVRDGRP